MYDIVQKSYVWARVENLETARVLWKELGYNKILWERVGPEVKKVKVWVSCVSEKGWLFAGLLPEIKRRFRGVRIKRLDYRLKTVPPKLNGVKLRPYQERAVRVALREMRGVIQAPTGSGKTVIAAAIISSLKTPRVLFIVHRTPLLDQTFKTMRTLLSGVSVGRVGGGDVWIRDVTVATIQTLSKWEEWELREFGKYFKAVIVDEAHHAHANTWRKVLKCLEVPVRIGLTATPHKLWTQEEYMKVTGLLGPIIEKVTYRELAALGYVALPLVVMVMYPPVHVLWGKWHRVYRKGIVENEVRNKIITDIARKLSERGSVLVHVIYEAHGRALKSLLPEAKFVTGKVDRAVQAEIKKSLDRKETRIVITTTVWKEGVDIPSLDAVILASGLKSDIHVIQSVGRALRPSPTPPVIVDFYDTGHKRLERHSAKRLRIYDALGWPVMEVPIEEEEELYEPQEEEKEEEETEEEASAQGSP
ncbi:MAG: hypothetical protein DRJ47_06585 [Thermoprotei archaeon]|nr:MAG: hypothetical protein DRJ47_06585 [Thermoprotei archaeon]